MAARGWRRWLRILWRVAVGLAIAAALLFVGLGIWLFFVIQGFHNRVEADLAAVQLYGCIPADEVRRANPDGPPTVNNLKARLEAGLDYRGSHVLKEIDVDIRSCDGEPGGPEHPAYVHVYRSTPDSFRTVTDSYAAKLLGQGWIVYEENNGRTVFTRGREFFAVYQPHAQELQSIGVPPTSEQVFATFYSIKLTERSITIWP